MILFNIRFQHKMQFHRLSMIYSSQHFLYNNDKQHINSSDTMKRRP